MIQVHNTYWYYDSPYISLAMQIFEWYAQINYIALHKYKFFLYCFQSENLTRSSFKYHKGYLMIWKLKKYTSRVYFRSNFIL